MNQLVTLGAATRRLSAVVILMLAGCAPTVHEPEEPHHLPAHHPRSFRNAVEQLALRGQALAAWSEGSPRPDVELREAADIVRWLPELAADTALSRPAWEQVRDACQRLDGKLHHGWSAGGLDPAVAVAIDQTVAVLREIRATLKSDAFEGEDP